MRVLEIAGACVAALLVLLFLIFFRSRLLRSGGGTIRLQFRVTSVVAGRGWSAGVGRFIGDELRFYRIFTFAFRPKLVLNRRTLSLGARRLPEGPERLQLPGNYVIIACSDSARPAEPVEIAMAESTVTGFSSWLEAGPPGPPGSRLPSHDHGGPAHNSTS